MQKIGCDHIPQRKLETIDAQDVKANNIGRKHRQIKTANIVALLIMGVWQRPMVETRTRNSPKFNEFRATEVRGFTVASKTWVQTG